MPTIPEYLAILRRFGKSDAEAEAAVQALTGVPAHNIPAGTQLADAIKQSQASVLARGLPAAQGYERSFWDASSPKKKATHELRGGITDPAENIKRTAGAVAGAGEYLWKGTPFGEEPPPEPWEVPSTEAGAQRLAEEEPARRHFEAVARDPKSSFLDVFRATPMARKMIEEAKSTRETKGIVETIGDDAGTLLLAPVKLLQALGGEFEAPVGKSSYQMGKEFGEKIVPTAAASSALALPGVDFLNQAAAAPVSAALQFVPMAQSAAAALKTLPGAAGLAGKLESYAARTAQSVDNALAATADAVGRPLGLTSQFVMDKFFNKDPKIVALMEEAFAEGQGAKRGLERLGEVLGGRLGEMLEAGSSGAGGGRVRRWGTSPEAAPGGPALGRSTAPLDRQSYFVSSLYQGKPSLGRLKGDALRQAERLYDFADDAVQILVSSGRSVEEARRAVGAALSQKRNVGRLTVEQLESVIDEIAAAGGHTPKQRDLFKVKVGRALAADSGGGVYPRKWDPASGRYAAEVADWVGSEPGMPEMALALDRALGGQRLKMTAAGYKQAVQSQFAAIADDLVARRTAKAISDYDDLAGTDIADFAAATERLRDSLPNVMRTDPKSFKAFSDAVAARAMTDRRLGPLAERLASMTQDPATGAFVSRPLAYIREVNDKNAAFRNSLDRGFGRVNSWLKQAAIPLNPKSLLSNAVGNAIAASVRYGTTPMEEMARQTQLLADYSSFLGGAPTKNERAFRAAQRTGLFGGDRVAADLAVGQILQGGQPASGAARALSAAHRKALSAGAAALQGGDTAAMLRVFTDKFDRVSGMAARLSRPGDSISFVASPNTRGTLSVGPDGGLTFHEFAPGSLGTRPQTVKRGAVDRAEGLDDVIGKIAGQAAGGMVFDYSRVPGYLDALKRTGLVGAGSPFYTYAYKALAVPGLKRGMLHSLLSGTDGLASNVASVNAMLAADAALVAARRSLLAGTARLAAEDPEIKRLYSYDPGAPGVQVVTSRPDREEANVARFSSANWMEGTLAAMSIVQSEADSAAAAAGTDAVGEYLRLERSGAQVPQEVADAAYNAALRAVARQGMTPEALPAAMRLLGIGGTQAFDTFNKIRTATRTGESFEVAPAVAQLAAPGVLRNLYNVGRVFISDEDAEEMLARGRSEDAALLPPGLRERLKFAFTEMTGLGSVVVSGPAQARRVSGMWKREMERRLAIQKKRWLAEALAKYPEGDARRDRSVEGAEEDAEILQQLLDEAAEEWVDSLAEPERRIPGMGEP